MRYSVSLRRSAEKALARLGTSHRDATATAIAELSENPRPDGCKKMQGDFGGQYRIKVRHQIVVIYEVNDGALTVLVVTIDKRGDAY